MREKIKKRRKNARTEGRAKEVQIIHIGKSEADGKN